VYDTWSPLGIVNVVLFFSVLFIAEVIFRAIRRKETPFVSPSKTMKIADFDNLIQSGHKLVILDDLVLDVSQYMPEHPGGKFLIESNIGRDISKFFYGAYAMENYV